MKTFFVILLAIFMAFTPSAQVVAQGYPPLCDPDDTSCNTTDNGCGIKCYTVRINLMEVTAVSHFVHTHGIK